MTTAVIISGQARTFARCFASLQWQVFSKLKNPQFFVSVADDADAYTVETTLRQHYAKGSTSPKIVAEKVTQPTLPEPPMIHTAHAPYAITPTTTPGVGPLQGILRQLWHLSRAYKFAMENGAGDCDVFVRCRPDLHFHRFVMKKEYMAHTATVTSLHDIACVPFWGGYGGVNDRFAYLGSRAAKAYFETYDNLPAMLADGIPFHPETLVGAALERAGCHISRTLCAEFGMLRPSGEFVHMQVLPGELAEWIAHLSRQ